MKKKKKNNRRFLSRMKTRLKIVLSIFMACFVVLVGMLIKINVKDGDKYEQKVLAQQGYSSTVIPYKRGEILDANGTVLATSEKVYNLILEPKNILEKEEYTKATSTALKECFGYTDSQISGFLADETSYYVIAEKGLSYEQYKKYMEYCDTDAGDNVRGVYFEEQYKRVYPNGELACHVLGFTVSGNVGMYGVEGGYNEYLNGYNGRSYSYLNEDNSLTEEIEPAVNGYNLVTSIDANVQKIVQDTVDEYMVTTGAKNVSVIVMEPSTCDILALYNSHQFDPNNAYSLDSTKYMFDGLEDSEDAKYKTFEEFKEKGTDDEHVEALSYVWRNFAVTDLYEPGSTYKVFTIAGAIEEGYVSENDTFFCDGSEKKDIYDIGCSSRRYGGHGELTLSQALEKSCNDALMQIAAKEGAAVFDKYQVLFGFGQRTNIDIQGEYDELSLSMSVYHRDTLNEVELATSSFGQGVTVTMMQLCTAFCSVINGGYYYEPTIVQRIEDEDGNVIDDKDNVLVRRTISEETSAIMREQLFKVVQEGTGKKASIEGYSIGGKTGTAEKLPRGNGKYLISFIGFAPVDNPQVVIYVIVDEPDIPDQSASPEASYIFADIATELFPYLNIYKDNDNFDLDTSDQPGEEVSPIYVGDSPENDVAGGEDNPYVTGADTDGSDDSTAEGDDVSDDTSDDSGDSGEGDNTDDQGSSDDVATE